MANGEGLFERVVALLQWRVEGEKEAVESTKKVEAAARGVAVSAGKALTDAQKRLVNLGKAVSAGGANLNDLVTLFKEGGASADDMSVVLQELGYSVEEVNQALGITTKTTKETATGFEKVAGAVKFAVFRFFTALVIYQALRKALRAVNEAIQRALKLWEEFTRAQQTLTANLEVNLRLIGDQVGTLEEWNRWIVEAGDAWGITRKRMTDAVNAVLQANTTLGLSAEQLEDIVKLARAAAIQWQLYTDGQPDVAKGTDLVIRAIRGEESAMLKLGVTQADVARSLDMTVTQFEKLPDAMQEAARHIFIMEERFEPLREAAEEALTPTARDMATLAKTSEETSTKMGESLTGLKQIFKPVLVLLGQALLAVGEAFGRLGDRITEFRMALDGAIPGLQRAAIWANELLIAWGLVAPVVEAASTDMDRLADKTRESGEAAKEAAKGWSRLWTILERAPDIIDEARDLIQGLIDTVREAAQPFIDLGQDIGDAIRDGARAAADALRNFQRRVAQLERDIERNRDRLLRRFAGRREELIIRSEQRKAEIIQDFQDEEENERDDLLMRLRHMEEDHLLDLKQLRDRAALDIEEAARSRDWRAIRTIQRRLSLETKQRKEDYRLDRKQFIESWNLRHKQRKKDLDKELKEVEDNLQKQLEALEREKQRELEELRIRAQERRDELGEQYRQEQEDLARALDQRVADILTAAVAERTIRVDEAAKATQALAILYGIDATNVNTMVNSELADLARLAAGWDAVLSAIAAGRAAAPITYPSPGGSKYRFAEGGSFITSGPTKILAGERGPELVNVIPLAGGGSVLGGMRGVLGGDFNLNIDGNQAGQWSPAFEGEVQSVVAEMFREAFES